MRSVCAALAAVLVLIAASAAVAQQPASTPAQSGSPAPASPPPLPPLAGQVTPAQPTAPAQSPQPRTFTAPVGLLFNTVRADRVDDFETAMGYLQSALAASSNERVRAQAAGWRIFKATEGAPGGAVLYVFLLDPTVVGADYSLGRILADAYPDQAKLREIWKLYSGSVTGGSLLNLTPVMPTSPAPPAPPKPAADTTEKP